MSGTEEGAEPGADCLAGHVDQTAYYRDPSLFFQHAYESYRRIEMSASERRSQHQHQKQ